MRISLKTRFAGLTCGRWSTALVVSAVLLLPAVSHAQQARANSAAAGAPVAAVAGVEVGPDYVIGPDDVLSIVFWKDKDLSGDVTVRPDGRITIPLLNDIVAAGLTPAQLRDRVLQQAAQFIEGAQATVAVKMINSRKVFITGQVEKSGSYVLTTRTTVLQLIAMAGGLKDFAKRDKIVIMRMEGGREQRLKFDYDEVIDGKNLLQNLEMRPGDTVIVP